MSLFKELQDADYFKYVEEKAHLDFIIQHMKDKLQNEFMISLSAKYYYESANGLKLDEIKSYSLDYRSCPADGESMVRCGLPKGLEYIKPLFEKRGLKFDIGKEKLKHIGQSYIYHEIFVNKKLYLIADDDFDRSSGSIHYLNEVEKIIDDQLDLQGSEEQVFKMVSNYGESIWYVIMDKRHYEIFCKYETEFNESQLIKDL